MKTCRTLLLLGLACAAGQAFSETNTAHASVVVSQEKASAAREEGIVDVTTLGVKNDGSADVSAIVNAASAKHALYFPPGHYLVAHPLKIHHAVYGKGFARRATKQTSDPAADWTRTWFISALVCTNGTQSVIEGAGGRPLNIEEVNILCHSRENAIRIPSGSPFNYATFISKVGIYNLGGTGVAVDCVGSRSVYVHDICIWGAGNYPQGSCGLRVKAHDCRLTNIEVMATQIGCDLHGCYAYGENMHLWTGCMNRTDPARFAWWKGTRGLRLHGNASLVGSNIYPDTCFHPFEYLTPQPLVSIQNVLYYDDGSERGCDDHGGAFLKAPAGSTPHLAINGGFWGVCGTDKDPYWMSHLYTPGLSVRGVVVRNELAICGKNLKTLCFNTDLPSYEVNYATNAACKVAEIFTTEKTGFCAATFTRHDGASWSLEVLKHLVAGKSVTELTAKPLNDLCGDATWQSVAGDGTLKLFLGSSVPCRGRFVTTQMTARFRPVDFGFLRTHNGAVRYRECRPAASRVGRDR